jgi:hypothetical protein
MKNFNEHRFRVFCALFVTCMSPVIYFVQYAVCNIGKGFATAVALLILTIIIVNLEKWINFISKL